MRAPHAETSTWTLSHAGADAFRSSASGAGAACVLAQCEGSVLALGVTGPHAVSSRLYRPHCWRARGGGHESQVMAGTGRAEER